MIDDDGDGDKEIFYSLGNTIYRKENHTTSPRKSYISDRPQIFTVTTMMREFFGIDSLDYTHIPHDMQIFCTMVKTREVYELTTYSIRSKIMNNLIFFPLGDKAILVRLSIELIVSFLQKIILPIDTLCRLIRPCQLLQDK
jgi:hypothetical protein